MKPLCCVGDCRREARYKGMCKMHYQRAWKHGDPTIVLAPGRKRQYPEMWAEDGKCSVSGCKEQPHSNGFCQKHYDRWKSTGNPLMVRISGRHRDPAEWREDGLCRADDCTSKAESRGLCYTHYMRALRRIKRQAASSPPAPS